MPQKKRTHSVKNVNPDLVGLELLAHSALLRAWARPEIVEKRANQWKERLPALRDAILVSLDPTTRRIRQDVAGEVVEDEELWARTEIGQIRSTYKIRRRTAEFRKDCHRQEVKFSVALGDREWTIRRGFTEVMTEKIARILSGQASTRSDLDPARELTAQRLEISKHTVKDIVNEVRTHGAPIDARLPVHRLLASTFLDVARRDEDTDLRPLILDALYLTRYHVLCLVYLNEAAHSLKPLPATLHQREDVERLCHGVIDAFGASLPGPFSEVLASG